MLEEDLGLEGVDYFGQGLTEQLFDTPGAIARIWRCKAYRRSKLVSAEDRATRTAGRSASTGGCCRATRTG